MYSGYLSITDEYQEIWVWDYPKMKKRASRLTGRDAHFFGVGTHRICLLLYKEIPVNPRRFSQV